MLVMMIIWVVGELEFLERWIGGKVPGLAPLPSDTFTRGLTPQPVSILDQRLYNTPKGTSGTLVVRAHGKLPGPHSPACLHPTSLSSKISPK